MGRSRIFTATQCAELWRRYKAGESILGIGRVLMVVIQRFAAYSRVRGASHPRNNAAHQEY
jgi:hypothetical protein